MIRVTALYPYGEGARFDIDYYRNKHVPMVAKTLGAACKGIAVERGIAGRAPGSPPPYVAVAHMLFESMDTFRTAFGPHAATLSADAPNYTDIKPEMQISEVLE